MDSVSVALRAVTLQHWLAILSMLSALVVPVAGIFLMLRWTKGLRPWPVIEVWLSGCSALFVYAAVAFFFAVCSGGEIGESGKNRLARAYGTPVVIALERYHSDSAMYPRMLSALVPRYLSAEQLRAPEQSVLRYPFEYRTDSGRFELLVRYAGPGMNECSIQPGKPWQCGGYF